MACVNIPLFNSNISDPEKNKHDLSLANIAVIGDRQCGKTSLIFRWLNGTYNTLLPDTYLEDIYTKNFKYELMVEELGLKNMDHSSRNIRNETKKHRLTKVQFLDCEAAEKTFDSEIRDLQFKQTDAFILCFDPTNVRTFESLKWYHKKIEDALGPQDKPSIFVCSTKSDIAGEYEVSMDQIFDFLIKIEVLQTNFFQVSAKLGTNTTELLCYALRDIKRNKKMLINEKKTAEVPENISCTDSFPDTPSDNAERDIDTLTSTQQSCRRFEKKRKQLETIRKKSVKMKQSCIIC